MIDLANPNSPDNFLLGTFGVIASLTANGEALVRKAHQDAYQALSEAAREHLWFGHNVLSEDAHAITDRLASLRGYSDDPLVILMWAFVDALYLVPGAPKTVLDLILSELTHLSVVVVTAAAEEGIPCLEFPTQTTTCAA